MVRAARVGAKEKLAAAEAEIARLREQLADPQRTADAMVSDAPGDGIQIVGAAPQGPKVTGGMTRRQAEEKAFGKRWFVKVTEIALPFAKDVHQVASYCRRGSHVKLFRANTEVLLPESEIQKLENECVVVDRRQVHVGEGGMELAHAKALNSSMELVTDSNGYTYLERRQPRFHVQRIRPEQESLVIS